MTRREAREQAFSLMFEKTFKDDDLDTMIADAIEGSEIQVDEFAKQTVLGALEHITEEDQKIEQYSENWKLNRLSRVTLSILRLAIYEMCYLEEIPIRVSINEAIEIAKKYATEEDAAFINGVLASVAAELGEAKRPSNGQS